MEQFLRLCQKCSLLVIIFWTVSISGALPQKNETEEINYSEACYSLSCSNSIEEEAYALVILDKFSNTFPHVNVTERLANVESYDDMKNFFETYIKWDVNIYNGNCSTLLAEETSLLDLQRNDSIFFKAFKNCTGRGCDSNDNGTGYKKLIREYHVLFLVMGILSLLGNGLVMINETRTMIKKRNKETKERIVYKLLILNLSAADLFMAIYLIVLSVALNWFDNTVKANPKSLLCDILGVMSVLSIQVTVSLLSIITGYRLLGILYPYKPVRMKVTLILISLVWFIWLVVALLPLFNEALFEKGFTRLLSHASTNVSFKPNRLFSLVKKLSNATTSTNNMFGHVIHELSKSNYQTNEMAWQVLKSFNLTNDLDAIGYYALRRGCTLEMALNRKDTNVLTYFSLSLIIINFVEFVFIFLSYIVILKNISLSSFKYLLPCMWNKTQLNDCGQNVTKRETENAQVYCRIFFILITDLICGMIICIIAILHYIKAADINCDKKTKKIFWSMPILMLILLPLNSVLNPFIYSFHSSKKRCCSMFRKCL